MDGILLMVHANEACVRAAQRNALGGAAHSRRNPRRGSVSFGVA
jgi:hypothetical protein